MNNTNSQTETKVLHLPKVGRVEKFMRIIKGIGKVKEEAPIESLRNRVIDDFIAGFCSRRILTTGEDAPLINDEEALAVLRKAIAPLQKKFPFVEADSIEKIRKEIAECGYTTIAGYEMDLSEVTERQIYGYDYDAAVSLYYVTNKTDPENRIAGFIHTPPKTFTYVPDRLQNAFILFHVVLAIYRVQWNENVTRRIDSAVAE
ncbi:MAG: hypothetical protein V1928_00980 [Parcubacteria group bacterium]